MGSKLDTLSVRITRKEARSNGRQYGSLQPVYDVLQHAGLPGRKMAGACGSLCVRP